MKHPEHPIGTPSPNAVLAESVIKALGTLERYGRINRTMIRILGLGVAVTLALGCWVGWNDHRIGEIANDTHTRCVAGNVFRQRDELRWNYLLALTPPRDETRSERAHVARIRAYIDRTDAQVRC